MFNHIYIYNDLEMIIYIYISCLSPEYTAAPLLCRRAVLAQGEECVREVFAGGLV